MKKQKWFASILNFTVPGLGQFYARKIRKGIIHYLLFFPIIFSHRLFAYTFQLFLVAVGLMLTYALY